jgi:hypothetical protein
MNARLMGSYLTANFTPALHDVVVASNSVPLT